MTSEEEKSVTFIPDIVVGEELSDGSTMQLKTTETVYTLDFRFSPVDKEHTSDYRTFFENELKSRDWDLSSFDARTETCNVIAFDYFLKYQDCIICRLCLTKRKGLDPVLKSVL